MSTKKSYGHKLNRGFMKLDVGSFVKFDDEIHKISLLVGLNKVLLINIKDGTTQVSLVSDLEPVKEEINSFNLHRNFQDFSDKEWEILTKRLKAIRRIIDRQTDVKYIKKQAKKAGVSSNTLYRWRRLYERTNSVIGLLPEKTGRAKGTKLIDDDVENIISQYIDTHYLTFQRTNIAKVIRYIRKECDNQNINPPSNSTIRRRIQKIHPKETLKRRGHKSAAKNLEATPGRYPDTSYPLEVVQVDHTPADIIIVDDQDRKPIGRPWITMAIDIHTRCVVGFYLSLDAPSTTSVALCLAHAINPKEKWLEDRDIQAEWPIWGKMNRIATDNGADFRSKSLDRSCLSLGIEIDWRPIGKSHWGGHIERLLGTVMRELHDVPGSTFSNIRQRFEYDSEKLAILTFSELEKYLGLFVTKLYHRDIHSKIKVTPLKKWETSLITDDSPGHQPRPNDPTTILLDLLPYVERYVLSGGVSINGIRYYDDVLKHLIGIHNETQYKGKKQIFKYDPRDITYIWFYDEDTQKYEPIPTVEPYESLSLWKLNKIKKHWKENHDTGFEEANIHMAMDEMDALINKASKDTKAARREKQREIERSKSVSQSFHSKEKQAPPASDDGWDDDAFD